MYKRQTYLYDDRNSLIHSALGFIAPFLPYLIGLVVFLAFLIYEVREPENPICTVGDVVEFLCGFVVGLYVGVWLGVVP